MQHWIFAALVFFGYVLVLAPLRPGLQRAARWRAGLAALGGLALSFLAYAFDDSALLRQWVMPPALLLLGYWASGQLFAAPMPGIERALCSFDRNLRVDRAIVAVPADVAGRMPDPARLAAVRASRRRSSEKLVMSTRSA